MRRSRRPSPVNEAAVAAALYEPADGEPDLVVVLGPHDRLPPSLVWELAYAELVFVAGRRGASSRPTHLAAAIDDFHGRRRRFGGLDDVIEPMRRPLPRHRAWCCARTSSARPTASSCS